MSQYALGRAARQHKTDAPVTSAAVDLHRIAACLPSGRVKGDGVSFQAPGHGRGDTSARVLPDPTARNGYRVHTFASDDPLALRDFVDERCGFPRWGDRARDQRPDPETVARLEQVRERQRLAREAEARIKAERVRQIWDAANPDPRGTIVEAYLREHRGLDLPASVCGHSIRFHPACPWEDRSAPAMVCAYRHLRTDEVVALHRTRLDPVTAAKVGRMALGPTLDAAIKLTKDAEVTHGLHVAEGVETALSGMVVDLAPMWAVGSVGGIMKFPVLSGIEHLTICGETGDASADAVEEVVERWLAAGREVDVLDPLAGSDLNDALRMARKAAR